MKGFLILLGLFSGIFCFAQEQHTDLVRVAGYSGWKVIQDGEVLAKEELKSRLTEVDGAFELWEKGRKQYTSGTWIMGAGIALVFYGAVY